MQLFILQLRSNNRTLTQNRPTNTNNQYHHILPKNHNQYPINRNLNDLSKRQNQRPSPQQQNNYRLTTSITSQTTIQNNQSPTTNTTPNIIRQRQHSNHDPKYQSNHPQRTYVKLITKHQFIITNKKATHQIAPPPHHKLQSNEQRSGNRLHLRPPNRPTLPQAYLPSQ